MYFIYSKDISFNSIDLLLIENDSKRSKEALLSANIHSFNLIIMPAECWECDINLIAIATINILLTSLVIIC